MSDALTRIWGRLDNVHPVFFSHEREAIGAGPWAELVGTALLSEAAPSLSARCTGCGKGHVYPVEWTPGVPPGGRQPILPCPECGPVALSRDDLRRWVVDVPALLRGVAAAAGLRSALEDVVPNHLWYLGQGKWAGRSHPVYFARFVQGSCRAAVHASLKPYPRAVLFHPTEHSARLWGDASPNPAVALESAVSPGPGGLEFDASAVEAALVHAGLFAGPVTKKRKPPPKRGTRADEIARLTTAVTEHLRSARDHASATREMTGVARLLPRPTQKWLARLLGITEYAVSRCFQDESARELRLYWEVAADLEQLLNFRGPIGGGPEA